MRILLALLLLTASAHAADLAWDDPGADMRGIIDGYIVYYSDGAENFTRSISWDEVTLADDTVTFPDIEDKLQLRPGRAYEMYLTAYNAEQESGSSNTVSYTVPGFAPPADKLPDLVIEIPAITININLKR